MALQNGNMQIMEKKESADWNSQPVNGRLTPTVCIRWLRLKAFQLVGISISIIIISIIIIIIIIIIIFSVASVM